MASIQNRYHNAENIDLKDLTRDFGGKPGEKKIVLVISNIVHAPCSYNHGNGERHTSEIDNRTIANGTEEEYYMKQSASRDVLITAT
jgi:hypothetical protein